MLCGNKHVIGVSNIFTLCRGYFRFTSLLFVLYLNWIVITKYSTWGPTMWVYTEKGA